MLNVDLMGFEPLKYHSELVTTNHFFHARANKNTTYYRSRVCGKDTVLCAAFTATSGSPPRMREILRNADGSQKCVGITPAYAGKTCHCYS